MYPQIKATLNFRNKSSVSKRTSKETNNNSHETSSPWNSLTSSSSSSSREDLEADREEDSLHVTHCRRNNVIKEDPHLDKSASTTKVLMSKMSRKENLFLSRKAASFSHEIVEKTVNSNHGSSSSSHHYPLSSHGHREKSVKVVVALHDFDPVNLETDLPLNRTEEYEVLEENVEGCSGWWRVSNRYGEVGLIPSNYVEEKKPRVRHVSQPKTSSNHTIIKPHSRSSSLIVNNSSNVTCNSTCNSNGSSSNSLSSTSTCNSSSSALTVPIKPSYPNRSYPGPIARHHNRSSSSPSSHSQSSSLNDTSHWYLPDLDRDGAERLLKSDGREGCFIVRFSKSQNLFTISLLIRKHSHHYDDIKHYLIRKSSDSSSYFLSENSLHFKSIEQLISYHRQESGALASRLKFPPSVSNSCHKSSSSSNQQTSSVSTSSSNVNQKMSRLSLSQLYGDKSWEIRVSELSLLGELGSGQFGVVRRGRWTRVIDSTDHLTSKQPQVSNSKNKKDARQSPLPTTTKTVVFDVAVKLMKEGTMSEADFVREAKVMTRLKHPNLVQLFGLCIEHRPICIVTEYMKHGSLLSFLRKNSTTLKQNVLQLLHFCSQVCEGMTYLEQKNYIHRDLAARNCLVGEGSVVKVADFGLTRFVSDSNEYTSSSGTKFPIKWAPPEVLWFTKFSSKSDVWAFGVLMWEVFTCGQMPYGKCSNSQVVDLIREGKRLERPRLASKDVFDFMIACWEELPEDRPSFSVLLSRIRQQLKSSP